MPSTITAYYTFAPATKARSSQVNTNFSNYRGDLLPINEATISASDNTHYLGGPDHYWAGAYVGQVDFRTSTTTASLILKGQTANTTGAFEFLIEGVTTAVIGASGLNSGGIEPSARTIIGLTFTANGSFTVPAGHTYVDTELVGGGGGGGGCISTVGGVIAAAGGGGAFTFRSKINVTAGDVLSIVVGAGGAGAAGTTSGNFGGSGAAGTASYIYRGGSIAAYGHGANGGAGSTRTSNSEVFVNPFPGIWLDYTTTTDATRLSIQKPITNLQYWGGYGGGNTTTVADGGTGEPSERWSGGLGGVSSLNTPGGGGGGSSYGGIGGAGGIGTSTAARNGTSASATAYGAGGGGGADGGSGGSSGGNGANGVVIIYYQKTT